MNSNFLPESLLLAGQYVRRNLFLTAASVAVMTLTFFVTATFVGAAAGADSAVKYLESKAQITVFFKNDAPPEKIMAIKDNLEAGGTTIEVKYISQEEALKIYYGQHKDEPTLLESVTASIFPPSLEIRGRQLSDLPQLAKDLENKEGVEEVVFFKEVVDTFLRWTQTTRLFGLILISILTLISVLITLITIGMTIYTRVEEIEVMRLVGATAWYIRLPFLFQGALYGLISAGLSGILFLVAAPLVTPYFYRLMGVSSLGTVSFPLSDPVFLAEIVAGQLFFGVFLGIAGSAAAIRKYLRF